MKAIGVFFSLSLPDYIKDRKRTNIARATHQTRSMRGHEALLDPDGHHRCSRRVSLVYSAFSLSLLVGPCFPLFPLILEGNIKIMWQPAGTIHLRFNVSFFISHLIISLFCRFMSRSLKRNRQRGSERACAPSFNFEYVML